MNMITKLPDRWSLFSDKKKQVHHIVWHVATGHWPKWPEIIHHIDENPFNNELGNLQLMTVAEHHRIHRSGEKHYAYGKFSKDSQSWKGDNATPHSKRCRVYRERRRNVE